MTRFVFQLDAVLRMRQREEDRAMLALAECERVRLERLRVAGEIESRVAMGRADWRDRLASGEGVGGVEMGAVRLQANSTLRDLVVLKQAAMQVAAAERQVSRARDELLQATRRRRAIEDLRQQRLDEWRSRELRQEQREMDEMAIMGRSSGRGELDRMIEGAV
ncbi:MAG: flagellar FliJ family protein [Phycisphaeraceae bacterium]|nr:flagellar FliJ family protein [Phycisphaeraceae bacterium]MCW5767538.1 flagellar FliJ family protein [Phycisphaeraceae bacterium]